MYKLIKPLSPSGKMEVTPEQSSCLQKELLKMGHLWSGYKTVPQCLTKPIVVWSKKQIEWADQPEFMTVEKYPTHAFTDHFEALNQQQP